MNYRHGYHAGNFADVVKHITLVAILDYLKKKDTAFSVIDTHAGRGIYDLAGEQAVKTGEAQNGIATLRGLSGGGSLETYLKLAGGKRYPGSPLIAAQLIRTQDRLVAIEKHPEEAAELKQVLHPFLKARVEEGDGYRSLARLLPPPERRGLVLIDPPFEETNEFESAAEAVKQGLARFATGIFLVWYPIKSQADARAFCGEVMNAAPLSVMALTIEVAINAAEGKLGRTGLLLLNPPYGFDTDMQEMLALIAPRLPGGKAGLEWLKAEA